MASLSKSSGMAGGGAGVPSLCCCWGRGGLLVMGPESCLVVQLDLGVRKLSRHCPGLRAEHGEVLWALPGQKQGHVSLAPGTRSAATWPAAPRMAACGSGIRLQAAVSASSPGTCSQSPVSGGEGTGFSTLPPRTAPSKSGGLMM